MMEIVALLGDGHTRIEPHAWQQELPLQFYSSQDELLIVSASTERNDLVGAEVLSIDGQTPTEALKTLARVIGHENEMRILDVGTDLLRHPAILQVLTHHPVRQEVAIRLRLPSGEVITREVLQVKAEQRRGWIGTGTPVGVELPLYRRHSDRNYWFEYLEDRRTLYFKFNLVESDPKLERFKVFRQKLLQFLESNPVDWLVIDLRDNPGGDNFLNPPFIRELMQNGKLGKQTKLYVVIGRKTFSAAMGTAVYLERFTDATFVGEPTGSELCWRNSPTGSSVQRNACQHLRPILAILRCHGFQAEACPSAICTTNVFALSRGA